MPVERKYLDGATSPYQKGLGDPFYLPTRSSDRADLIMHPPFRWQVFENCKSFDSVYIRMRQLLSKVQAGKGTEEEKKELERLDEQLTESVLAIGEVIQREIEKQQTAFIVSLQYVDAQIQLIQYTADRFFAPEGKGIAYAVAFGGILEGIGKFSGDEHLEGIGKAFSSVMELIERLDDINRKNAEVEWKAIERTLISSANTWKEADKNDFNIYTANANKSLNEFRSGNQLCDTTAESIQGEYDKWIQRESANIEQLWIIPLKSAMDDLQSVRALFE
jgi:hypothetical protein